MPLRHRYRIPPGTDCEIRLDDGPYRPFVTTRENGFDHYEHRTAATIEFRDGRWTIRVRPGAVLGQKQDGWERLR